MAEAVIEIAKDADTAFECLCDIRSVPKWVRGVAKVEVLETDERERATVARFISMPARASVSYTLCYQYEDGARRVRWQPIERGERTLEGQASIEDLGEGRCRLTYQLTTWNAASIPMWARSALRQDGPRTTVEAFRRWVERPEE